MLYLLSRSQTYLNLSAFMRGVVVYKNQVLCSEEHYRGSQQVGCVQIVLLDTQGFHALA